jgi:hypothetical protein
MNIKYAMYPGRWQNFHAGHEWLIRQQLDKGKNVWIAIRDVIVSEENPKSAQQVMLDLIEVPFISQNINKILITIIPNIESVNYGRGVGYDVIHHHPPADVELISGTQIRKGYMDTNGDVIEYAVD